MTVRATRASNRRNGRSAQYPRKAHRHDDARPRAVDISDRRWVGMPRRWSRPFVSGKPTWATSRRELASLEQLTKAANWTPRRWSVICAPSSKSGVSFYGVTFRRRGKSSRNYPRRRPRTATCSGFDSSARATKRWAAAAAPSATYLRPPSNERTVLVGSSSRARATQPLAVGPTRAIEVDRVAPGVGDGGIETAELFFERCSVLGPYRLEKLLEQRSEPSHDLYRRCAELADLGESQRHEIFPAVSHHDDGGRRLGAVRPRALLEIRPPDEAENSSDLVENLQRCRGIVDRG